MTRRTVLGLATVCLVLSASLSAGAGGQFTVFGLRVSVRSPAAPAAVALILLVAWLVMARRAGGPRRDLEDAWRAVDARASAIVATIALVAGGVAAYYGTYAASGSDASGYLSEAALWVSGRLGRLDPLLAIPGWPPRPAITVPLGWREGLTAGWQVPTYPPGLPMLMAVPHALAGPVGACLVVSAAVIVAVWATGRLAERWSGGAAGIVAALVLATTPIFLFQAVQPMSDVPVTAAWLLCWWLVARAADGGGQRQPVASGADARTGGAGDTAPNRAPTASLAAKAGLVAAVAVLIRPNLAPLAVLPFAALALVRVPTPAHSHSGPSALPRDRATAPVCAALLFAWPVACAGAFVAGLQWYWYGSPLTSGYGTAGQLFTLASVGPNAGRYAGWLLDAAPLLAAAPLGLLALHRLPMARWTVPFVALNVVAYLVYAEFDSWPYLRFMLPGLALGAVWLGAGIAAIVARMPLPARAPVLFCLLLVAALLGATGARDRMTFDLADQQHRLPVLGRRVRARTPSTAVIIASEQSGSMRYYANRSILRWDDATVDEMRAALAALAGAEREVWVAIDTWEEPLFRQKFGALPIGGLDWPPAIDAGTTHRTRAWRVSDRDRYRRGESVETERLQ